VGEGGAREDAEHHLSGSSEPGTPTVVVVAYGLDHLDVSWVPAHARVVIVHNDDLLEPSSVTHPQVEHLSGQGNVGFGAGVNLAAQVIADGRMIVANPDAALGREHWEALTLGSADELVTIPLVSSDGAVADPLLRYPTPLGLLVGGLRLGRIAPLGSRRRRLVEAIIGSGRTHRTPVADRREPLLSHWVSGAVFSVDIGRFRSVGGFSSEYFLYYEDVDLCGRLAERHHDMVGLVRAVEPCRHDAGGAGGRTSAGERHRLASARTYAAGRSGISWRAVGAALAARQWAWDRR
jgi:N-acetylglucosaminyl-diphospho-decaprenol L-rhamnosyltransferase